MFTRILALAVAGALVGFSPVAATAKTHHHHKHHMWSAKSSAMLHGKKPCRDPKTGRFVKCAK